MSYHCHADIAPQWPAPLPACSDTDANCCKHQFLVLGRDKELWAVMVRRGIKNTSPGVRDWSKKCPVQLFLTPDPTKCISPLIGQTNTPFPPQVLDQPDKDSHPLSKGHLEPPCRVSHWAKAIEQGTRRTNASGKVLPAYRIHQRWPCSDIS